MSGTEPDDKDETSRCLENSKPDSPPPDDGM